MKKQTNNDASTHSKSIQCLCNDVFMTEYFVFRSLRPIQALEATDQGKSHSKRGAKEKRREEKEE